MPLFSITLFLSASLLFVVQPMFAKNVLPLLGGSPSVWNTCMVFYQATLLGGYIYSHFVSTRLTLRLQMALHLLLLLLALVALPIAIPDGWTPPAAANPVGWLLFLLGYVLGLPLLMTCTTAPLLQKWFSQTSHPAAGDPYFLYAASNLGSMIALLSYPLIIEPWLRTSEQSWAWSGGYLLMIALVAACGLRTLRSASLSKATQRGVLTAEENIAQASAGGFRQGPLRWMILSLIPSSLLLGVTMHITTDTLSVPLFWVVPLALYLFTFVLVFARRPPIPQRWMVWLQPFLLIPLALVFPWTWSQGWQAVLLLHLITFFVTAMVCHGELARSRPSTHRLTEFYLWVSVGGVLGGMFNALIAPLLFDSIVEYPLMLALACLVRPGMRLRPSRWGRALDVALPILVILAALAGIDGIRKAVENAPPPYFILLLSPVAFFAFVSKDRALRFGGVFGALLLSGFVAAEGSTDLLHQERSFFGVVRVRQDPEKNYRVMVHGNTMHGAQSLDPERRREPLTYYHPTGPIGDVFAALREENAVGSVAVIGLGTGSMAYYGRGDERWTFFELDPTVVKIARNDRYFTFLKDADVHVDVVLGDARIRLAEVPDRSFDLLVVDAFSSDAIPVHLITREAVELYLTKLKDPGVLAFHVSNRYIELSPILSQIAGALGLTALIQNEIDLSPEEKKRLKRASSWAIMARQPGDLHAMADDPKWVALHASPGGHLWTDDFSNLLGVLRWH